MSLVHIIFIVPLVYFLFYLIAWLYARRHFPNGD